MQKVILISVLGLMMGLSGCADTRNLELALQTLTERVDQLETDIATLNEEQGTMERSVTAAKKEADRANQRLDNLSTSYKK